MSPTAAVMAERLELLRQRRYAEERSAALLAAATGQPGSPTGGPCGTDCPALEAVGQPAVAPVAARTAAAIGVAGGAGAELAEGNRVGQAELRRCVDCGVGLPDQVGRGRRRLRCEPCREQEHRVAKRVSGSVHQCIGCQVRVADRGRSYCAVCRPPRRRRSVPETIAGPE